jgi:LmbE family N-acetylglucosaminyl deacetylase
LLGIPLSGKDANGLSILCIGAHADDIEIGCGGTVLRMLEGISAARFHWIVFSANKARRKEAVRSANLFLKGAASKEIAVHGYRDGFFPYQGAKIKEEFERLKKRVNPDVIFTHCRHDLHQDHRELNQLTWNTFRNHFILEYEIPKYDGDLGAPNVFVPLEESHCKRKAELLDKAFQTQRTKHWFSDGTFLGLMRLRGVEGNSPTRFAEGFYGRKLNLWLA